MDAGAAVKKLELDGVPYEAPPSPLVLKDYQVLAVRFGLKQRVCYLALDPGLGKTIVAATIIRSLKAICFYIAPPTLMKNIEREFRIWHPEAKIGVWGDRKLDYRRIDILIIPDSILFPVLHFTLRGLMNYLNLIFPLREKVLIIDEAHRYANEKAARTQTLLSFPSEREGLVGLFPRVIYMSGTPKSNAAMELYPILSRSAPEAIGGMNKWEYGKRYCDGKRIQIGWGRTPKFAWEFKGSSNMEELARRVIHPNGRFMLRLRKDRLKLPPLIEEIFVFSKSMSPRLTTLDGGIGREYEEIEDLIKAEIGGAASDHVATYRKLLGLEKVKAAAEYVNTLLEETQESIIIFAFHREVISEFSLELMGHLPIVITGEVKPSKRQKMVDDFQAKKTRLAILNYKAAGVGLNMTAASRVIMLEFSWNPADNRQAIDRAHRMGQENGVFAQYMCYDGSLDKRILEFNLRKRADDRHV